MKKSTIATLSMVCSLLMATGMTVYSEPAYAVLKIKRTAQGQLGAMQVNPYGYAPLSAVIDLNSKSPTDVTVTVRGKGKNGVPVSYSVGQQTMLTHNGIPVFGLYGDYANKVDLEYKLDGKKINETYTIVTQPVVGVTLDGATHAFPQVTPVKVENDFKERLYWVNHLPHNSNNDLITRVGGGAFEWDRWSVNFITDTQGEVRWYLDHNKIHDIYDARKRGVLMGVHQVDNGDIIFGQGQRYYRMDLMGRMIMERDLPAGFIDFSHDMQEMPNGNYLIRAAKKNYVRPDGKVVHTIRDHIVEVDPYGQVVDYWDLNTILDPMRDDMLKAMDARAVCINVDDDAGPIDVEPDAPFGDVPGVGIGRNWAHVNSVDYDASDDSIIISPRHQTTAVKIGRDKKVKWILGPSAGWKGELATKLLTPVDAKGKKLDCSPQGLCEDTDFDFGYAQHTSFWVPEKDTLTIFDNGDGRHLEQPAMPTMKYSRAVEYRINEDDMTVEQIWEYGKERGYEFYSPITSVTEYQADKDSMMVYFASANLMEHSITKPKLVELEYGTQDVKVELHIESTVKRQPSYRTTVIRPTAAFSK
ncbi:aryl-sulfate sulfotransferase [Ferrimonas lipolytica]|uniref:Aryl-sulfate sulfotransferase n=1 Tax=Ferrimonas lipolytica TaxID=2724191 RepID=A0A6H1UCC4_9GAMM|nr:aryl-sulfate sulfotransferase [Ferrimonas lipolytica]QIZ76230.1 aryl-sulfate sulfotransferase [Ferrimonas lipolytica]